MLSLTMRSRTRSQRCFHRSICSLHNSATNNYVRVFILINSTRMPCTDVAWYTGEKYVQSPIRKQGSKENEGPHSPDYAGGRQVLGFY